MAQGNFFDQYDRVDTGKALADKGRRGGAEATAAEADIPTKQAKGKYAERQEAAATQTAEAAAASATTKVEKEKAEEANRPDPAMAKIAAELQNDNVLALINTARAQVGQGLATGNIAGTKGFQSVPLLGQNSTDLAGTLTGLQGNVVLDKLVQLKASSPTGASGLGALSESEGKMLASSIASLQQVSSEEALLKNLAQIERHYRNVLALSHGEDPRVPTVAQKFGIIAPDKKPKVTGEVEEAPSAGGGKLTAEGKFVPDPALKGANAKAKEMILAGQSAPEVRAYLNSVQDGLGDRAQGIEEAVTYAGQHHDKAGGISVDIEKAWEPSSDFQRLRGEAAQTPAGTALIGAGDVLSGGLMDNATGNPEEARAIMMGLQETNPGSYLAGQVGGGFLGAATGEGLLTSLGGMGRLGAGLASDTLASGIYGAGSADDPNESRLWGGVEGSALGAGGNLGGRALFGATGHALRGVTDPFRRLLHEYNIPMTPAQIMGGPLKAIEDRLSGLPVVGDFINARRREGVQGFDRAANEIGLAPVGGTTGGEIGELGQERAHQAVSEGYNRALGGVDIRTDPQYIAETDALRQQVLDIPDIGPQLHAAMEQSIVPYVGQGGRLTGDSIQDIFQNVRNVGEGYRGSAMTSPHPLYATHVRPALNDYSQMLEDLVGRYSPDTIPDLRAANLANRNVSTIDDAVLAAANQGGEFMPSQLMRASKANTTRFSGKRAAAEGRGTFFDLARAGQEVLPSKIPDSGTVGRAILPALIGGFVGSGDYVSDEAKDRSAESSFVPGALSALAAAALFSGGSRTLQQRLLMAQRPRALQDAGNVILRHAMPRAHMLASPYAVVRGTEEDVLGD